MARSFIALCAALAAACSTTVSSAVAAPANHDCGAHPYSYAGFGSAKRVYGVAARLTSLVQPEVASGHVAGWVGVGGLGAGPNGEDAWLQVGLNSVRGSSNKLYYEVTRPGQKPEYVELDANVAVGATHRVAVLEMAKKPSWWRVWIDGRPRSEPIFLAGSHGRWHAMTIGESWNGGGGACNRYAYRFERVSWALRPGGSWRRFRTRARWSDPGYAIEARSSKRRLTFSAVATFPVVAAAAPAPAAAPTAPAPSDA